MAPHRRAAVIAGALLIAGIIGALAFAAIEQPLLTATASLARIAPDAGRLPTGGLLELATAGASAGIAIVLYPVLRRYSEGLALGAVIFRAIESVLYAVAGVITLALPGLARQYAQSGAPGRGGIQATASALAGMREDAILAAVLAYVAGALMYYSVLYRWRLVPRWLAGWGVAAEALMLAACAAAAYGHHPVTSYTILILPIVAQELAFGAWLIIRGFNPGVIAPSAVTGPALAGNPGGMR